MPYYNKGIKIISICFIFEYFSYITSNIRFMSYTMV